MQYSILDFCFCHAFTNMILRHFELCIYVLLFSSRRESYILRGVKGRYFTLRIFHLATSKRKEGDNLSYTYISYNGDRRKNGVDLLVSI